MLEGTAWVHELIKKLAIIKSNILNKLFKDKNNHNNTLNKKIYILFVYLHVMWSLTNIQETNMRMLLNYWNMNLNIIVGLQND